MEYVYFGVALGASIVAYMSCWYVLAVRKSRFDVVDSAWGLGFVIVAWLSLLLRHNFGIVQLVSAVLVSLWGLRLFLHITKRTRSHQTEDHRYQELRAKWGPHANRTAFWHIFLVQGALILVVSMPMIAVALGNSKPTLLTYIGWAIWLFGICFEAIADSQLRQYLANRKPNEQGIMSSGLWHFSRHPNYFGEVTTWWGASLVAISVGGWWGIIGAITITYLIVFVSGLPPLERHYKDNTRYQEYAKRTSVFFPLPPKDVV